MKLVINGVGFGVDGKYDFPDPDSLKHSELRLIKRESGVRSGEIMAALQAADTDLLVCFALIALGRAGKTVQSELLWESEVGSVDVELEEADVSPPEPPPDSDESRSGPSASSSSSTDAAGDQSQASEIQSPSGSPG